LIYSGLTGEEIDKIGDSLNTALEAWKVENEHKSEIGKDLYKITLWTTLIIKTVKLTKTMTEFVKYWDGLLGEEGEEAIMMRRDVAMQVAAALTDKPGIWKVGDRHVPGIKRGGMRSGVKVADRAYTVLTRDEFYKEERYLKAGLKPLE